MSNQPTPAAKRPHPSTPIGRVLNKYAISLRDLEKCLQFEGIRENTSRSTLHRMVRGELRPEQQAALYPTVSKCLKKFLINRGLNAGEIDSELTIVFTEGEYQPMIINRVALTDAECTFFDFLVSVDGKSVPLDPFKNPPQSREEVFFPAPLREVYDKIVDAVKYKHFVAVLGPIGSGKTTLRAMVEDHVADDENLRVIWPEFFDQSRISAYEIARTILRDCDAAIPGRAAALGKAVSSRLRSLTQNGKRVAIAFDECHKMAKATLRSLKNFHEMSSGGFQRYLGIVLLGWPEFEATLEEAEFQEIRERVEVIYMPEFSTVAAAYLEHRFAAIGKDVREYFDDEAIQFIASNSETPLGLGNIANQALRITRRDFDERKVLGSLIQEKMFFDKKTSGQPGFRKR